MKSKRTRRVLVVGALIGSMLSIGATTGTVSAKNDKIPETVQVVDDVYGGVTSLMRSGIRW